MSIGSFRKSYKTIASIMLLVESMGIASIDLAFLATVPQRTLASGTVQYSGAAVVKRLLA